MSDVQTAVSRARECAADPAPAGAEALRRGYLAALPRLVAVERASRQRLGLAAAIAALLAALAGWWGATHALHLTTLDGPGSALDNNPSGFGTQNLVLGAGCAWLVWRCLRLLTGRRRAPDYRIEQLKSAGLVPRLLAGMLAHDDIFELVPRRDTAALPGRAAGDYAGQLERLLRLPGWYALPNNAPLESRWLLRWPLNLAFVGVAVLVPVMLWGQGLLLMAPALALALGWWDTQLAFRRGLREYLQAGLGEAAALDEPLGQVQLRYATQMQLNLAQRQAMPYPGYSEPWLSPLALFWLPALWLAWDYHLYWPLAAAVPLHYLASRLWHSYWQRRRPRLRSACIAADIPARVFRQDPLNLDPPRPWWRFLPSPVRQDTGRRSASFAGWLAAALVGAKSLVDPRSKVWQFKLAGAAALVGGGGAWVLAQTMAADGPRPPGVAASILLPWFAVGAGGMLACDIWRVECRVAAEELLKLLREALSE
jgi:hypothetical protein